MARISLFDHSRVLAVLDGLKLAEVQSKVDEVETETTPTVENRCDTDASQCLTCDHFLPTRELQIEHYKSDWHRYNLKLKVGNLECVSEEKFGEIMDEISSISGSETESSGMSGSESDEKTKLDKALEKISMKNLPKSPKSVQITRKRTQKVHFKNSIEKLLSVYKCILPFKDETEDDSVYVTNLNALITNPGKTCVMLLSAGHFAAGIFEGNSAIVHKTFHRYVLRAKQGTVQSLRDKQGSAPKSGGASLRRHNEAALVADIQTLLNNWKDEHLSKCSLIFLRTPHYNKSTFYNGKSAPLDRKDLRIKGIPFPTRRPTFNELKRVHNELFSVEVYDKSFAEEKKVSSEGEITREMELKNVKDETTHTKKDVLVNNPEDVEYVTSGPKTLPKMKQKRRNKKGVGNSETESMLQKPSPVLEDVEKSEKDPIIDELYTVCKTGDLEGLKAVLASVDHEFAVNQVLGGAEDIIALHLNQAINKNNDTLLHIAAKSGHREVVLHLLHCGADPASKNLAMHVPYNVSADKPMRNTFRKFMADNLSKYDYKSAQIPAPLTEEMENEKKQKLNEKKKAQKALKKERMKEKKAERKRQETEQQERERFAALSDREKRALAAERRFAKQLSEQGNSLPNSTKRCWLCGESLMGKIPFEYFDFQFCTINCLKKHKSMENANR